MHLKYVLPILILFFINIYAFKRHEFDFCDSKSYCSKHHQHNVKNWQLADGIFEKDDDIILTLKNKDNSEEKLTLLLTFYEEILFRIRFDYDGYINEDSILKNNLNVIKVNFVEYNNRYLYKKNEFLFEVLTNPFGIIIYKNEDLIFKIDSRFLDLYEGSPSISYQFARDSKLFGIPEHAHNFPLDNSWNSEPWRLWNLDVFEYDVKSNFPLYGAVPLIFSHSPGLTVATLSPNPAETVYDIDGTQVQQYWEVGQGEIYVWGGTTMDYYKGLKNLLGTTPLPRLETLGYHQNRWNYKNEEDCDDVIQHFEDLNFPFDFLWLDIEHTNGKRYLTWDTTQFPDPDRLMGKLEDIGRSMVVIADCHIKKDNGYHVYKEATDKGFLIKRENDNNNFEGNCWPGMSVYPDFTRMDVRSWWGDLLAQDRYQSRNNVWFWNDMNEPSVFSGKEITLPRNAKHMNGTEHKYLHNSYGYYFHRATAEGLVKDRIGERPFVLTRSFFAGSQRYHAAVWTGDNMAKWEHLKMVGPMLLSLGVTGISFVGADVGGFFYDPNPELLVRWYESGAWNPFFRAHAHIETKRREPWLFGDEVLQKIRNQVIIRYRYLPLWYTLFYESEVTGVPVVRPIWHHFDEQKYLETDHGWMVGDSIFVWPVTDANVHKIKIPLPIGTWYSIHSDTAPIKIHKNKDYAFDAPLGTVPVFIREGGVILTKERLRRSTKTMTNDPYTLNIYGENAQGNLYLDDGHTFNYKLGNSIYCQFRSRKINDNTVLITSSDMPKNFEKLDFTYNELHFTNDDFAIPHIERIRLIGFSKIKSVDINDKNFEIVNKDNYFELKKMNLELNNWSFEVKLDI
eukprot:TRINITY_DN11497_c0_g1_i1.p1 TRINITY_DN11497_c0_g1~~TRINITY_DN11497_c0_g1_i1.p1  ORF type:complete len:857 (+),score=212.77 TRINITY_DN11497_c0_g1_i1:32-2572(+)